MSDNRIPVLLNVGLEANSYYMKLHTRESVLAALAIYDITPLQDPVQVESDSEPTLVIRALVDANLRALYWVSSVLNQDAIAVWNIEEQEGKLVGPRADKWGEFDPHYFFCLDGSRLDAQLALEGED